MGCVVFCQIKSKCRCSLCCFQVVSLLLCQGAEPNARDNWNYTPLHEAAIKGKIDVCIGKHTKDLINCFCLTHDLQDISLHCALFCVIFLIMSNCLPQWILQLNQSIREDRSHCFLFNVAKYVLSFVVLMLCQTF